MKVKTVSERATAYAIPGRTIDGNDVLSVYQATVDAGERARAGKGPTLLELETYRYAGHSRSDPGHYRPKEEVAEWKKRDPIVRFETQALAAGLLTDSAIAEYRASVDRELDEAVAFAESSPSPPAQEC